MAISANQKRRYALLALVTILSMAASSSAQKTTNSSETSTVKIKNFGQMDERFYRGAQPKEKDYKDLAQLGIRTIIDLRDDPEEYAKPIAESLGMTYINIPMIAKKYPTPEATEMFLKNRKRSHHRQVLCPLCRRATSHRCDGRRLSISVL